MLWEFNDACWTQDDVTQSFKIERIYGEKCDAVPIAPLDLLVGAKHHSKSALSCALGEYPSEFMYCPYCQTRLLTNENDSDLWLPPYGLGSGLKIYDKTISNEGKNKLSDYKAKLFPLPSRDGCFSFCSVKFGAKKRLLIAVQRDSGQLWVYRPDNIKKWEILEGEVGEDSLPSWSWSMAVDQAESGLCIPTNTGPVWLTPNWALGSITVNRVSGKSIGAPLRIQEFIVAPVLRGDLFVMVYRREGDIDWSECPSTYNSAEIISNLRRGSGDEAYFGIPILDENKRIAYWPCRGGYISMKIKDMQDGLNWHFRCWETDEHPATALIELGPPYHRFGSASGFWQLCEDRDISVREGIVNKIIKIDGNERIDTEKVECGEFLSTGRICFSWSDDYWDDINRRNPRMAEQTELRLPLIQFGEKGLVLIAKVIPWEGRDELGVFTDLFLNKNLKITVSVRLVLEGSGISEKPFFAEEVDGVVNTQDGSIFRMSLPQLLLIKYFIYDNSLFIYFPESNNCFSWPLALKED